MPDNQVDSHVEERSAKIFCWNVSTTVLSGTVGPPAAGLVLLASVFLPAAPTWADPWSAVPSYLALLLIFAVPVGYVFGIIPSLLAGALYAAALNAMPTVRVRPLFRAWLGAVCGGVTSEIWFHFVIGPRASIYAAVAALIMALFALCRGGGDLAGGPSPDESTVHSSTRPVFQTLGIEERLGSEVCENIEDIGGIDLLAADVRSHLA